MQFVVVIRFIFKNGFEVRVQKWDLWHSGRNAWVLFCWKITVIMIEYYVV